MNSEILHICVMCLSRGNSCKSQLEDDDEKEQNYLRRKTIGNGDEYLLPVERLGVFSGYKARMPCFVLFGVVSFPCCQRISYVFHSF